METAITILFAAMLVIVTIALSAEIAANKKLTAEIRSLKNPYNLKLTGDKEQVWRCLEYHFHMVCVDDVWKPGPAAGKVFFAWRNMPNMNSQQYGWLRALIASLRQVSDELTEEQTKRLYPDLESDIIFNPEGGYTIVRKEKPHGS